MGNGPADVKDYWEIIYKYPKLIGGCIWEWADHTYVENNVPKYGGDFGELTDDNNFCADGIVMHDRSLTAGSLHTKYTYQYARFELEDSQIRVTNLYDFTNLNQYLLQVQINVDGKNIEAKEYRLDVKPKESRLLPIDMPDTCELGAFAVCRLLDEAGEEVAMTELTLPVTVKERECTAACDGVCIAEDEYRYLVTTGDTEFEISKGMGEVTAIRKNGIDKLLAPMQLTAWRAPMDNDSKMKVKWGHTDNSHGENLDRIFNNVHDISCKDNEIVMKGSLAEKEIEFGFNISC